MAVSFNSKPMHDLTNKELLHALEWCGRDPYYDELYTAVVKEIRRRLNGKGKAKKE